MPTTGTINTQQLIQMGTHTEKLQHTLQHLPTTNGQQLQEEQIILNVLKQVEIQDPENLEQSQAIDSKGKRRRETRLRGNLDQNCDNEEYCTELTNKTLPNSAPHQGRHLNITI